MKVKLLTTFETALGSNTWKQVWVLTDNDDSEAEMTSISAFGKPTKVSGDTGRFYNIHGVKARADQILATIIKSHEGPIRDGDEDELGLEWLYEVERMGTKMKHLQEPVVKS